MKFKKENTNNDEKMNIFSRFISTIKNKCITDTTRTVLLVLILIALFIGINLWVQSFDLLQKDFTEAKQYTLTDKSKDVIKNVSKDVIAYVWGFNESDNVVDLLKQYHTVNNKINYQVVTLDQNPDLVEKYGFEEGYYDVAIVSNGKIKNIYASDMSSYDSASGSYVDITEQKITNAILNVTSEKTPKIYFLEGNNIDYSIESGGGMYNFASYIEKEGLYELNTLNLLNAGSVPEDCDTLIISSVVADFTEEEANYIKTYINNGGNLLILNDVQFELFNEMPNFKSILDLYGISLPNKVISEGEDNSIKGLDAYMYGNISPSHEITKLIKEKPILLYPGIIELSDAQKMAELKVTYDVLLNSSDNAYSIDTQTKQHSAKGSFVTGVSMSKLVSDGVFSKLIVYNTNLSFSDVSAADLGYNNYSMYNINAELLENSIAFLNDRGELYSIAKLYNSVSTYLPTKQQDRIVVAIICALPIIIITVGILIWNRRRRKK